MRGGGGASIVGGWFCTDCDGKEGVREGAAWTVPGVNWGRAERQSRKAAGGSKESHSHDY